MATITGWRYRFNTFESNTRGSNIKMLSLSTDTHAKLKAEETNPAIADIILIYEPVFFAYRDLDQQYGVRSGEYAGKTLGFEEYLDQIPQQLRQWESLIRAVYVEDTPEERAIFPNKRTPFINGTYESRLDALGSLKLKVAADPALSTASTQITSFYNASLGARLVQQTGEGALQQLSDLRENQRIILSEELMGVLGTLLFIHRHNLTEVERYFDLSLLRDNADDVETAFTGTIDATSIINLNEQIDGSGIEIDNNTVVRMSNNSPAGVSLTFYLSDSPTASPGAGPQFTIASGSSLDKTIGELGAPGLTFFNIQNPTGEPGNWGIELNP